MGESMSEDTDQRLVGESSRRTFVKHGALASGALALGMGGVGSAVGQDGGDGGDGVDYSAEYKALMFTGQFHPAARIEVISPVVNWSPEVTGFTAWSDYNTRFAKYQNTNERVPFFPANDAEVQQGQLYSLEPNASLFPDDDQNLTDVTFSPVRPDDGQQTTSSGNQTGGGNQSGGDGN